MRLTRILVVVLALVACALILYLVNRPSSPSQVAGEGFVLVDEGTAIQRRGETDPFIRTSDLPDTVPPWFPHAASQRFDNRRFRFISVSPNNELIAFAAGEGDQWMGMINAKEKYLKFLIFGVQTTFLDAAWSPDSKFLAFAFWGPDKRVVVYTTGPPGQFEPNPKNLNIWFRILSEQPKFKSLGWREANDTVYSFAILDATGKELQKVDLPLRFDPNLVPDYMKKTKQ